MDGMYADPEKQPLAEKNHHMMFREAAEIAAEGKVSRLILTHFSTSLEEPREGLAQATEVFPDTETGRDGMILSLKYPQGAEPAEVNVRMKEDW